MPPSPHPDEVAALARRAVAPRHLLVADRRPLAPRPHPGEQPLVVLGPHLGMAVARAEVVDLARVGLQVEELRAEPFIAHVFPARRAHHPGARLMHAEAERKPRLAPGV